MLVISTNKFDVQAVQLFNMKPAFYAANRMLHKTKAI